MMAPLATLPPAAPPEPVASLAATGLPGAGAMVVPSAPTGAPTVWTPVEGEPVGGTDGANDGAAEDVQPARMRTAAGRIRPANRILAPDRRASADMAVRLPSRRRMRLGWRAGLGS